MIQSTVERWLQIWSATADKWVAVQLTMPRKWLATWASIALLSPVVVRLVVAHDLDWSGIMCLAFLSVYVAYLRLGWYMERRQTAK